MDRSGKPLHPTGMDRRVARTRRALQHAFLRLTLEKGYDAVSIQDICEAANVGRSTFYLHFTGKDDLKRSGLDHLRQALNDHRRATAGEGQGPLSFSRPLFEHAKEHLYIYRALAGSSGGGVALATIRDILLEQLRDDPLVAGIRHAVRRDMRLQFLAGAFMSVLVWWLDGGAAVAIDEVDAWFREAALRE